MMQYPIINQQHDQHRHNRCQQKCFSVPYSYISRQTVTAVIHPCTYIFQHRISKYISNQCASQRHAYRKNHIMMYQFFSCVAGCPERSDDSCFISYRIADRHAKYKCHDHNNHVEKYDDHRTVTSHVLSGEIDRLILISWNEALQRNFFANVFHQVFRYLFFQFLILRFLVVSP